MVLYQVLQAWLNQFKREEGQGMAEYGLILVLVAVALIVAFVALSGGISTVLGQVESGLSSGS